MKRSLKYARLHPTTYCSIQLPFCRGSSDTDFRNFKQSCGDSPTTLGCDRPRRGRGRSEPKCGSESPWHGLANRSKNGPAGWEAKLSRIPRVDFRQHSPKSCNAPEDLHKCKFCGSSSGFRPPPASSPKHPLKTTLTPRSRTNSSTIGRKSSILMAQTALSYSSWKTVHEVGGFAPHLFGRLPRRTSRFDQSTIYDPIARDFAPERVARESEPPLA